MKTVGLAKVDWIRLLHTTQRIHFTHSLLSALENLAPDKGREYDERGLHRRKLNSDLHGGGLLSRWSHGRERESHLQRYGGGDSERDDGRRQCGEVCGGMWRRAPLMTCDRDIPVER